jgi:hypothetical protein
MFDINELTFSNTNASCIEDQGPASSELESGCYTAIVYQSSQKAKLQ